MPGNARWHDTGHGNLIITFVIIPSFLHILFTVLRNTLDQSSAGKLRGSP